VDPYLSRVYRKAKYTCLEFTAEVWKDLTREDIGDRLRILHIASADRRITPSDLRYFQRLGEAASPCIALMRRPKTVPHMGVALRGRILHLNEMGAAFQSPHFAGLGFKTVTYYR
jgi:hypothetical protein